MKKFIILLIIGISLTLLYLFRVEIIYFLFNQYIENKNITIESTNEYAKESNFLPMQKTENFFPDNKQDIINIFYTVIDSGIDTFSFYCTDEYPTCADDVEEIATNTILSSAINNYVHPYNSYNILNISFNELGKVTLTINKLYNNSEIVDINTKIDNITKDIIKEEMSITDKIRAFHDYIIDYTTYDSQRAYEIKNNIANKDNLSHKTNGLLNKKLAICGGYTDTMAIFLNQLKIPNIKISTSDHIWNLVYLDNIWYHLDLTWDDPVLTSNQNIIIHEFFLITTKELEEKNTTKHIYEKDIYLEAK
ncbi:MAG: hypothetical protein PHO63_02360 [Bacilli bacterium]|nr:hypothetical protein [Bacilli bacterium]MDD4809483.1 hypothetical protein [Bacilli bacterium]